MKIRYFISVTIFIVFMLHFAASGLIGSQGPQTPDVLSIEKTISSVTIQTPLQPGDKFKQDESIFSKTTIISLIMAVMGIVAFRRNTYS